MRITTDFGPKHVEDRLYFDTTLGDSELRVAQYALEKFGVAIYPGEKVDDEDATLATFLIPEIRTLRHRINRGYPTENVWFADKEATLIEDAIRKLGELPVEAESLSSAEAYMRARAAEITAETQFGPHNTSMPATPAHIEPITR